MYSDAHLHIDAHPEAQLARILEECRASGVEIVVAVSSTLAAARATIDYARRFPMIIPHVGMHPWHVTPLDEATTSEMRRLAREKDVAGIGEIGIDLEKDPSTGKLQWEAFREQLALARDLSLPLNMHSGGGREQMKAMLKQYLPVRGVLHGFAGDRAAAQSWLDLGLYVSIGVRSFVTPVAGFEAAVRAIPLNRLLVETDSSARSYAGEEALHPVKVLDVAAKVALLKGATPEDVGRQATANLRALYGR